MKCDQKISTAQKKFDFLRAPLKRLFTVNTLLPYLKYV